jgi:nucleotide-binding universal stress UspA family protein
MTMSTDYGRVVVGYDGRWQPPVILDVAAAEAERLGRAMSIVTLVRGPEDVASAQGRPRDGWQPQAQVWHLLNQATQRLRRRHGTARIAAHCLRFDDVHRDAEPFVSAVVLVLGEHGNHGVEPFGLESASRKLRGAVECPVLLVPDDEAWPRVTTSACRTSGPCPSNVTLGP